MMWGSGGNKSMMQWDRSQGWSRTTRSDENCPRAQSLEPGSLDQTSSKEAWEKYYANTPSPHNLSTWSAYLAIFWNWKMVGKDTVEIGRYTLELTPYYFELLWRE